jgi:glucose-1-phosphate cytidylyltransferase
MVEIGGKPILSHIMKIYSAHGIVGYVIKEWLANYFLHNSGVTIRHARQFDEHSSGFGRAVAGHADRHRRSDDDRWPIKRILPFVADDPAFCLTYGDGVGDVDISQAIALHRDERRLATVTATQPPGRFGSRLDGNRVTGFQEKPIGDGGGINGGYFVLSPKSATISTAMRRCGNANRWSGSPPTIS